MQSRKPPPIWRRSIVSVFIAATLVKVLLLPSYYSTDREVHRNWKAITFSLRPSQWYFDATSPWTLDYPPLFAVFEALWARVAFLVDPGMVRLAALDHHSWASVAFMRYSVMTSDLCLLGGTWLCAASGLPGAETSVAVLVLLNACLLLVDHVHFQYNGFLVGVLLASIGALRKCAASDGPREQARWGLAGGAAFAALLGLKHLYLPLAFVYFVHLLFGFCRVNGRFSLGHFAALGVVVLTVLGAPFLFIILDDVAASGGSLLSSTQTQLRQISGRLFPFGGAAEECRVVLGDATATLTNACHERGLVHAYWAANFWALYLTADRVLIKALQILHATAPALARALPLLPAAAGGASATAGLVGRVTIQVLPQITPALAAVLTLVAMLPAVAATAAAAVRTAGRDTAVFERSLAHASLSAFVFGWHVHEKAILGALAPLSLLAAAARPTRDAAQLLRLSALGGFALFPLFTHPRETPTKLLVFLASLRLAHLAAGAPRLASIDRAGAVALAALFLFNEVAHPLVFAPRHRFEFLPLMLTSTLCAAGICACWAASAAQLTADAARYLGGKGGTEKRQP